MQPKVHIVTISKHSTLATTSLGCCTVPAVRIRDDREVDLVPAVRFDVLGPAQVELERVAGYSQHLDVALLQLASWRRQRAGSENMFL